MRQVLTAQLGSMTRWSPTFQDICWLTALVCVAALPFEMVISVFRHQLYLRVGPVGYLFHPALGIVAGCLLSGRRPSISRPTFSLLSCLGLYATGLLSSALANQSETFYTVSTIILGPLFMGFVLIAMQDDNARTEFIKAFVAGLTVWAVCFFLFYLYNCSVLISAFPHILEKSPGNIFLATRGQADVWDRMLYFNLLGNFNKQANILFVGLLLASYLYLRDEIERRLWLSASIPMSIMIFVMFSRGAFGAIALVAIGLALTATFRSTTRKQIIVAASFTVVVLLSLSTRDFRNYWLDMGSMQQREEMAISVVSGSATFQSNGDLSLPSETTKEHSKLCNANQPDRTLSFLIFGYGIGKYGPTICRDPAAESHNAFADSWIQGGIVGLLGYVALYLLAIGFASHGLWQCRLSSSDALFGLAIVCGVAVLAVREYSFIYLWVQSAGGFLLAIGLSLCTPPNVTRRE